LKQIDFFALRELNYEKLLIEGKAFFKEASRKNKKYLLSLERKKIKKRAFFCQNTQKVENKLIWEGKS